MTTPEGRERKTTLSDLAYAYVIYELGSKACHSARIADRVLGAGANPTQWRVARIPADALNLQWAGREGGEPPRYKNPKNFPWAVVMRTPAVDLARQQEVFNGVPAVAIRPAGNVIVAARIPYASLTHEENFQIGLKFVYDARRPDDGGLEFDMGLFHEPTRTFWAAQAGVEIVSRQVSVTQFAEGGQYNSAPLP